MAPEDSRGRGLWIEERRRLHADLSRLHPNLGAFYERAVQLLQEEPTAVTMCLLAHAVRELVNLAGEVLLEEGQRLPRWSDVNRASEGLANAWRDENLPSIADPVHEEGNRATESDPTPLVTVPRTVFSAAAEVVIRVEEASINAGARYSALATGFVDRRDHATTQLVRHSIDYFRPWFHVRRTPSEPKQSETERHFLALEQVLRTRTAAFFDVADDLAALLEEANSTEPVGEEQQ